MNARSNGRILQIAVAVSLAMHLVFASLVHPWPVTAAPEQPLQHIDILRRLKPPPPKPAPTPPPKPALPHPQSRARSFHVVVHTPRVPSTSTKGPAIAPPVEPTGPPVIAASTGPDVAPTSGPIVATPTPKPACSAPDVPAKTLVAQTPEVPEDAQAQGYTGTAKVKVDLDASGNVTGTSIYTSTGSMELDRAALAAARASRYAPEERNCKTVPGSYLFIIEFQ
jgi:protein TonB